MRGSNPTLREDVFHRVAVTGHDSSATMTVNGVIMKSSLLLLFLLAGASYTWYMVASNPAQPEVWMPWLLGSLIVGFILGLVISFVPRTAAFLSPVYAVAQGVFLGALSSMLNQRYEGIALMAVALTMGVFVSMLLAYRAGLIKATEKFKSVVIACTLGIVVTYGLTLLLGLFGVQVPYIHSSGPIGIVFSLFCITIASLNLIIDFDFIEQMQALGAPKATEWYASFGLLVTVVWLYIEILRLLAKLRR
ncbi:MAG: Bax inhibitor-1/YccA family protein [Methanoregulaceae archaeon]|nr:Bax inhibitor-1/YccA family protein [Methanoregulaceae archaeon]